jgi:hypothetical protein
MSNAWVLPTIVEPLRADWEAVKAAAVELADAGNKAGAVTELRRFHAYLCGITILDPACGTGNFLDVALEHLKAPRAPLQSPSWYCGSVTCNGISGSWAMRNRPSRFCATSEISSIMTLC